jgi:hypothetical protein
VRREQRALRKTWQQQLAAAQRFLLRRDGHVDGVQDDVTCASPSTAATVIYPSNQNGTLTWKQAELRQSAAL